MKKQSPKKDSVVQSTPVVAEPPKTESKVLLPESPSKQRSVRMSQESDHVTKYFIGEIQKEFNFPIEDRLAVVLDTDHFKSSEDHSVWLQAQGKAPKMAEVYWDGEWIIDFALETEKSIVMALFWNGFYKAYTNGRIRLNQGLASAEYQSIESMIESSKKKVTITKPESEMDRQVNQILAEIASEKKEKRGIN